MKAHSSAPPGHVKEPPRRSIAKSGHFRVSHVIGQPDHVLATDWPAATCRPRLLAGRGASPTRWLAETYNRTTQVLSASEPVRGQAVHVRSLKILEYASLKLLAYFAKKGIMFQYKINDYSNSSNSIIK